MTIDNCLNLFLKEISTQSARLDVELLLALVLQRDRSYVRAFGERELSPTEYQQFSHLCRERARGVPMAYLCEEKEFYGLSLRVTPDVLIPRPETELLVDLVLSRADNHSVCSVLDMGTGSGAIALAIKTQKPAWQVMACDISEQALAIAKNNAQRLQQEIIFVQSDWFSELSNFSFDIIIANPPYIAANDEHLLQGDVRFEPKLALVAEQEGLAALSQIIRETPRHLSAQGLLLLEHGYAQGFAVQELLKRAGFSQIETVRDLNRHERASVGRVHL